jgi:ABC-2 type transport system permease protein
MLQGSREQTMAPDSRTGVIHDLGYRPYGGPRLGETQIAGALFVTGLRNAFGLGRSGKSKLLPFILLGLNLAVALIIVAIMVFTKSLELFVGYAAFAGQTQLLLSVFAAAQAPVLFSRDLRYGSIVLYLARPMSSTTYALMRWSSLAAALLTFLVAPILVLLVGALLAEADVADQLAEAGWAILVAVLLAGMLASVTGVISAFTTRRGFGVVASIAVLLFGYAVIGVVQNIAYNQGSDRVGEYAGLLNPYTLYRGISASILDSSITAITPPASAPMETAYVVVSLLIVVGGIGLLAWRYRKAASK